jgi:hypothetical protein
MVGSLGMVPDQLFEVGVTMNNRIEADQGSKQLMKALNQTIQQFTTHTPMSVEQIVICLGYMTGRAIGHIEGRNNRRVVKQAVDANMETGIDQQLQMSGAPAILMPALVKQ